MRHHGQPSEENNVPLVVFIEFYSIKTSRSWNEVVFTISRQMNGLMKCSVFSFQHILFPKYSYIFFCSVYFLSGFKTFLFGENHTVLPIFSHTFIFYLNTNKMSGIYICSSRTYFIVWMYEKMFCSYWQLPTSVVKILEIL